MTDSLRHVFWLGATPGEGDPSGGPEIDGLSRLARTLPVLPGFWVAAGDVDRVCSSGWDEWEAALRVGLDGLTALWPDAGSRFDVWAPQGLALLNVVGAEAVTEAVIECAARGRDRRRPVPGVVVQPFVPAEAWALVTSRVAVPGGMGCVAVRTGWGVAVDPVRAQAGSGYLVERFGHTVVGRLPLVQSRMLVAEDAGVRGVTVPDRKRRAIVAGPATIARVAKAAIEAERTLGRTLSLEIALLADRHLIRKCHLS